VGLKGGVPRRQGQYGTWLRCEQAHANGCKRGGGDYSATLSLGGQACPHLAQTGVNKVERAF